MIDGAEGKRREVHSIKQAVVVRVPLHVLPCMCTCLYNTLKENKENFSSRCSALRGPAVVGFAALSHCRKKRWNNTAPFLSVSLVLLQRWKCIKENKMDEGTLSSTPEERGYSVLRTSERCDYLSGGKCKALWEGSKNSDSIITFNMQKSTVPSVARR